MKKSILVAILFASALATIPASGSSVLDLRVGNGGDIEYWRWGPSSLWCKCGK